MTRTTRIIALLGALLWAGLARAETITVAVAANFTKTAEAIGAAWEAQSGHEVRFAFGPSGKLLAQIQHGAPFDAYFSADTRRPQILVEAGEARDFFVYAGGKLALYSATLPVDENAEAILADGDYRHLAMANPKAAPYGAAAKQVLEQRNLYERLKTAGRIVQGESIGQAFQFAATGNAQLGFVALSQLQDPDSPVKDKGHIWMPPTEDYDPIRQGAVALTRSRHPEVVDDFLAFVRGETAAEIIRRFGYDVP
ncbi:molybdate ABC transporter substrate-binding protein [Guyparkeria hydrothermalis]|uniref:molybdate ABC transporter substrate-binding protein n=1 Tax=Guyparkeria hydrothermalis TaxID=923 RepID=UPI0020203345|nr:molybdate ABC transporter substrate-binding protein [Guyparkeria hydrothermalis]MCL7745159.1 molybdate ABC transporter substrate-binding protein [Guyparkeria hydrothermalis]